LAEGILDGSGMSGEGRERLLESELVSALQGRGTGKLLRGRKPGAAQQESFLRLMKLAAKDDGALNRALGEALVHCGLIRSYQAEATLGTEQVRASDLLCQTEADPVRLEIMWRQKTSRAEIANYVLTKLYNYGHAIGFLNGS
jgi:DNA (cytosine-5)-methyltransferase 1